MIGVHDPLPYETLTEAKGTHVESGGGTAGGRGKSAGDVPPPNVPRATRQDLALAEEHRYGAEQRLKDANATLENKKQEVGDLQDLLDDPTPRTNVAKVKERLAEVERGVEDARARYKQRKAELRAAESKVDRLTGELKSRGELQPKLDIKWNLPDKPTTFRYKSVEAKSWRPDGYVGTTDNRQTVEKILNEDPGGELGKRLLQNGKLVPTKVGDMNYWKAHPEMIEMAHVLSKREGGREVYIVMTKARNQAFSANLERTGGVFKEDAIVLQGVAIDKPSAVALGVPQSVITRAPVITFSR